MQVIRLFIDKKKDIMNYTIIVLIIHMFRFTNDLPSFDSMWFVQMQPITMVTFGRWLFGPMSLILHSPFDLQWVDGLWAAVLIALSMVVIVELFQIRNKCIIYISVVLFAAFPSMASTFCYSACAPVYMLSLFLSILAVYFCVKMNQTRWTIISSALCIAISLALYQIYISIALILFLFNWGNQLISANNNQTNMRKEISCFSASIVSGLIIYWLGLKAALRFWNTELDSYQGVSSVGFMLPSEYAHAIKKTLGLLFHFYYNGDRIGGVIYSAINIFIALTILVLVFTTIIKNKNLKLSTKFLSCLCFLSYAPVTYCFNFVSNGVEYHRVMELGNYFVYFLIILLLNHTEINIKKAVRYVSILLLVSLCFYHFVNDNIAYNQLSMSWERTEFEVTEILMDIDHLDKPKDCTGIAIMGNFPDIECKVIPTPHIQGASTKNFLDSPYDFVRFVNYYYGKNYTECSEQDIEAIKEDAHLKKMPEYPTPGYVSVIDNKIVVKLVQ